MTVTQDSDSPSQRVYLWPGPIQIFPFQVLLVPQCMPQDTSKRGFFGISPTYDGSYNSVFFFFTGLGTSLAIINLERMWNMEVTHLSTKQRPFYFGLKQSGDVFDLLEPARSNIDLIQIEEHNIWTYLIFHHLFPILLPSLVLSYFLQCMQCMKSPISIIRIGL